MRNLVYRLRLDDISKCSRNIWLSWLAVLFLMSLNYRAFVIPLWLIIAMSIAFIVFSLASFVGFIYWLAVLWNDYSSDRRIMKFLYLIVLGLLNLMSFYILLKVMGHPG
jgi:hypothetical protein